MTWMEKTQKKRGGDDNASEDLIDYYEDDSRIHIPNVVDGKKESLAFIQLASGNLHSMLASQFYFFLQRFFS